MSIKVVGVRAMAMTAVALMTFGVRAAETGTLEDPIRSVAMRVGTYNIGMTGNPNKVTSDGDNSWIFRKDDLVALVRKMDLDVFGLQEVTPCQAKYLREKLPEYAYVGEHRNADRVSGEASPVCYRKSRFEELGKGTFWLSETPDVPGLKGWGAACPRVCSYLILRDKTSGKAFCFANTHTDHISKLARERGLQLVVERMKKFGAGVPIVFTGDHNCRETDAPAKVVSKVLNNAVYETETPPKGGWRTFNGWRWLEREVPSAEVVGKPLAERNACGFRIDYIYVSPGVRVLDYATVNDVRPGTRRYPSDHFPVTATVVLP